MGKFLCGAHIEIEVDDRVLAHLQMVIGAKLRRNESMLFSWRDSVDSGDGRTTAWLHPLSDVTFKYYGGRKPAINSEWVELLMLEANKPGGLQLVPEPVPHGATPEVRNNPLSAAGHPSPADAR